MSIESYKVFFRFKNSEFWEYGSQVINLNTCSKNKHEKAKTEFIKKYKKIYNDLIVDKVVYI